MHHLAKVSLRNRALIILITLFISAFGVVSMNQLKQELMPSVEFPIISVAAQQPGASPQVMDEQVAQPLERSLQAVEGLESTKSTSRAGLTTIQLSLDYGTNMDRARNQVERAISNARDLLPDGVSPTSFAGSFSDFPVVYYAVSGEGSLSAVADRVTSNVIPEIERIDGVRQAQLTGASSQYVKVTPDEKKMKDAGLTEHDLQKAISEVGRSVPLGSVEDGSLTLPAETNGAPEDLDEWRKLPIAAAAPVQAVPESPEQASEQAPGQAQKPKISLLGDVAKVELADEESSSITRTNGELSLALSITKTPEADTVKVAEAIEEALPQLLKDADAEGVLIFDQSESITSAVSDLTKEGLLGLVFAVLVILIFLLSFRSTLVTAISIPLSLLATFIGLFGFGYSLNMLTLGALTISIGRVVDDAIVVIENIRRHLANDTAGATAGAAGDGVERDGTVVFRRNSIVHAVKEVAGAITASTLTTVAVFAPIAFVSGLAGELFRPFALTVTIALLASLVVSLTIVPVLAYWFISGEKGAKKKRARRSAETTEQLPALQRAYRPVLRSTQKHPVITLVASVALLAGSIALTPLIKTNMFGDMGETSFDAELALPTGSSLATTEKQARMISDEIEKVDGVRDVQYTVGSGTDQLSVMMGGQGSDTAQFIVMVEDSSKVNEARDAVEKQVGALKGLDEKAEFEVSAPGTGGGFNQDITIEVQGTSPEVLATATKKVTDTMRDIPQVNAIKNDLTTTQPTVLVDVDRKKAAEKGLGAQQVGALLNGTIEPLEAGRTTFGFQTYSIKIGEGKTISSIEDLEKLTIPTVTGEVKVSDVAKVTQQDKETVVVSRNTDRIAQVTISPTAAGLGSVADEVGKRLDQLELPDGAHATIGGAATQQADAFMQLGIAVLLAIAIVYIIMVATFRSLIQPFILLVSIPFAFIGSLLALLITQIPLGLPSLIGMLMLVGIVVTNAIVLIDLINQYRDAADHRDEGERDAMVLDQAIELGALRRLRPILMTALATIGAMIPTAFGLTGGTGGFISQPLAVVVIGGLISSTLLTLILVPVLYRLVEGRRERKRLKRAEQHTEEENAPA
ncbi:efflux RND transporter permease subunit [Pseudoglutamicibacter albus]|uniref:efflux RND transporter permease subunit n=1 Tax=Pseudoglutamicibacter albus TaxID=98671 RepID=UPI000C76B2C9|nr:efflux RND transporter permease subunit [Pseudoglutamicibacter albus]PKY81094.1 hydrogenase expression protein [Pseudoglutamicibacter albus]WIK84254.1 efflux RND transporter permease subunit [Pseudoglutamicibacter albus]